MVSLGRDITLKSRKFTCKTQGCNNASLRIHKISGIWYCPVCGKIYHFDSVLHLSDLTINAGVLIVERQENKDENSSAD